MNALKEALSNAILESQGSGGAQVQITVPNVAEAIFCIEQHFGGCDYKKRNADGSYEIQGSEDLVDWSLLIKAKP